MAYTLYRLEFLTGLHIGREDGGESLDDCRMTIHSDTIFSALCCECSNTEEIQLLHRYFSNDDLTISGAFPYTGDEYFLPKPVLFLDTRREGKPGQRKELKSIEFIPCSLFDRYLRELSEGEMHPENFKHDFGIQDVSTRVALRKTPQPYNVAYWRFAPGAGLYIIVRYKDQSALTFFESILVSLGCSGIGGKQSSGLGKFNVTRKPVPPGLEKLLEDEKAGFQMLLGTALPEDDELDHLLSDGWYSVVRRGGFVRSASYSDKPLKKRTLYMLAPGSCLKKRFHGGIFDVSEGGTHPVWRCGKTLFAGVRI